LPECPVGALLTIHSQVFERLQQRADPKVLEEQQQAVNERMQAIYQKAQNRLAELVWSTNPRSLMIGNSCLLAEFPG
jgi:hypothetical protein